MFLNDGIKVINDAIGEFEKIKQKLESGIQSCNQKIEDNKTKITTLQEAIDHQNKAKARAEKVVSNLNTLIGA